jgi:hypothetical protein
MPGSPNTTGLAGCWKKSLAAAGEDSVVAVVERQFDLD